MKSIKYSIVSFLIIVSLMFIPGCINNIKSRKGNDESSHLPNLTDESSKINTKQIIIINSSEYRHRPHVMKDEILDDFQDFLKKHLNVNLEFESGPLLYDYERFKNNGGATPPDLFIYEFPSNKPYEANYMEYAEPLSKYIIKDEKEISHLFPQTLEAGKLGDEVYMLPIYWRTLYMELDINRLLNAGVNYPSENWTVVEMLELAEKLTKYELQTPENWIAGLAIGEDDINFYYFMIKSMGGELYRQEGNEFIPTVSTDKKTMETMGTIANLVKEHVIGFSSPEVFSTNITGIDHLKPKRAAMLFPGANRFTGMNQTALISLPKGPVRNVGSVTCTGISIFNESKNKELCWELLKYMVSEGYQRKLFDWDIYTHDFTRKDLRMPTTTGILKDDISNSSKSEIERLTREVRNTVTIDHYEFQILQKLRDAMMEVYKGKEDLAVVLQEVDDYAREYVFK